jgi:uncharacterized protein involved in exopolysaccharide biosynthesis
MQDGTNSTNTEQAEAGSGGNSWFPQRPIRPFDALRRYRWISLVVACLIVAAGFPLALYKGQPKYYAEAAVRVSRNFAKNLKADDELSFNSNSDYRQFVQQQVREIASYDVARETLDLLGERRALWQLEDETPRFAAERLMGALRVRAIPDTYLVTIGLEGDKPDGLAEIVNTVARAYLDKQKSQEIENPALRLEQLAERRKDTLRRIDENTERLSSIGQELGVTSLEEKFLNPYDNILKNSSEALAAARRRRIAAEAKLASLDEHLGRVAGLEVDSAAQRILANDRGVGDTRGYMSERRSKLVLELSKLGDRHPGRKAIERELTDMEREVEGITEQTLGQIKTMLRTERRTKATEERSRVEAEVEETRRTEAGLEAEIARQRDRVAWFARLYNEALNVQRTIEQDRQRLGAIEDRVQFITLESEAPGFLRLASSAREPQIPVAGGRRKWMAIFIALALVVAVAIPILADRIDPRVHTPAELESLLGFAPLGWLPRNNTPRAAALHADRMRRLAMSVEGEHSNNQTRFFAVTSMQDDTDTASFSLELAAMLNRAGRRTSVVGTRFAATKSEEATLAPSRAQDEEMTILDGSQASDTGEESILASTESLKRFMLTVQEQHEIVLVPVPSIRVSADAEVAVRGCEATLLVAEATETVAATVRQMASILARLHPPVVGAVLNNVRVQGGEPYAADLLADFEGGVNSSPNWLRPRWLWGAA